MDGAPAAAGAGTRGGDGKACLSGQLAVLRSGHHLAQLAARLRDLEAVMIVSTDCADRGSPTARSQRRSRMQALDLMIQEVAGLSDILIATAPHLSDLPNPAIEGLIDVPRLQSLARALRDLSGPGAPSETVLF